MTVESIAAGGDGVGRLDGLAVFVPRTAPGEVVEVKVRKQGRLGRGELLRVEEPSPDRVTPACTHYDADDCGGCQLQHLAYNAQLEAKRRIVEDAFARIARRPVAVPPLEPSPSPWEYRSRLTLTLRQVRQGRIIGLHARGDPGRVFSLRECPITAPRVVAAWREIGGSATLLPATREMRGSVRLLGEDLALVLEGGEAWPLARDFAGRCPSLSVIRWVPASGSARVICDRRTIPTPEAAFDQVNQPVASRARREVVDRVMAIAPRSAVDAYAGLGVTAQALASRGVRVTAIEVDAEAAAHAARGLPAGSRVVKGRVEEALPEALPADAVVLNPPRAGVDPRVIRALEVEPRPRRVLYMSCDPATLARDVLRLPSYRVASLRAYDMFPQTAHVEVVCELAPEDA